MRNHTFGTLFQSGRLSYDSNVSSTCSWEDLLNCGLTSALAPLLKVPLIIYFPIDLNCTAIHTLKTGAEPREVFYCEDIDFYINAIRDYEYLQKAFFFNATKWKHSITQKWMRDLNLEKN